MSGSLSIRIQTRLLGLVGTSQPCLRMGMVLGSWKGGDGVVLLLPSSRQLSGEVEHLGLWWGELQVSVLSLHGLASPGRDNQ